MKKLFMATAVAATALLSACNNGMPKANMKSNVDTLSYEIGLAYSEAAKGNLAQMQVDSTYIDEFFKGVKEGTLAGDDKKKMAYYMGILFGLQSNQQMLQGIERQIFGNDSTKELSRKNFLAGLSAGLSKNGRTIKIDGKELTPQTAYEYAMATMDSLNKEALAQQYSDVKKKSEDYVANLAKQPGIKKLQGGVLYKVIKEGTGAMPTDSSRVEVIYEGKLINGNVFDSSKQGDKNTTEFPIQNIIKGLGIALTHMPVGSEWEITIPWNLAYGEQGQPGGGIPPFSTLIFKVTLVSTK